MVNAQLASEKVVLVCSLSSVRMMHGNYLSHRVVVVLDDNILAFAVLYGLAVTTLLVGVAL